MEETRKPSVESVDAKMNVLFRHMLDYTYSIWEKKWKHIHFIVR